MANTQFAFALMIYLGIGFIISAVVLWTNFLELKDKTHIIALIYMIMAITATWGLFTSLYVIVAATDFVNARWPMKQVSAVADAWWKNQFRE